MTRILMVTTGSHGDVFPFLAVARVLIARGVAVDMLVNPAYDDVVREAGVRPLPLGERMTMAEVIERYGIMHPAWGALRTMRMMYGFAPVVVARTREVARETRPDAILAHHICVGAVDVGREMSIPSALTLLAPAVMFSRDDPILNTQGWPGASGRAFGVAMLPMMEYWFLPMFNRMHNRARKLSGLARVKDATRAAVQDADLLLALWSDAYRELQPDDPPNTHICGFTWYDGDPKTPAPPGLDEFLDDGEPPILFCLGTTAVYVAKHFYDDAIEAAKRMKRRALLLAGPDAAKYDRPADGIRAFRYARLSHVVPKCAATVIHGGIGTTAQSLRAGKPTLVAPFAYDQFNNGVRVHALGVGDSIHPLRLSARRMAEVLERLLGSDEIRARATALGARVRAEDGSAPAAEHLLSLVGRSAARAPAASRPHAAARSLAT